MVKNVPVNERDAGDVGLIPGSGRSSGGGNGNPLQYSCLKNPIDRGAWWATVHEVTESDTTGLLSSNNQIGPRFCWVWSSLFVMDHPCVVFLL